MSEIPEAARLTPSEIAYIEWPDNKQTAEWLDWYVRCTANYKLARAIADAQLKKAAPIIAVQEREKLAAWLNEPCEEHRFGLYFRHQCFQCLTVIREDKA